MEGQVHSWEGPKLFPQDALEGLPSQGERAGQSYTCLAGREGMKHMQHPEHLEDLLFPSTEKMSS